MCLHHRVHLQSYVTSCNSVEDNIVCGNICDLMFIRDRNLTRFCSNEINEMLLMHFLTSCIYLNYCNCIYVQSIPLCMNK